MVAITVILAAVIGTFVLGLGDNVQSAPQASIDFETNSAGDVTITHRGGDALTSSEVELGGAAYTGSDENTIVDEGSPGTEFTAGESVTIASANIDQGEELNLIYTAGDSDTIIASYDVPAE